MEKIRIGNDITLRVSVTRQGVDESLDDKELRLLVRSALCTKSLAFTRDGSLLTALWKGTEQEKTGTYTVTLIADYGEGSRNTVDQCGAFALVPRSCDDGDALTGAQTIDLDLDVAVPANGLSAYEIARLGGYEGTQEEWLASLSQDSKDAAADCRALAEEFTTHPTKMGDNGNWWAWDMEKDEYYDTGVLAKGSVLYPTFYVDYSDMNLYMAYQDTTNEGLISVDGEGYLCLNTTASAGTGV